MIFLPCGEVPTLDTAEVIVLLADADADLAELNWTLIDGYAVRTTADGRQNLAREVMRRTAGRELLKDDIVDHINRVRSDNRRSNLRIVSRSDNARNISCQSGTNKSGYPNVYWNRAAWGWDGAFRVDGRRYHCGTHNTPAEAHQAVIAKKREMGIFGELLS